MHIRHAKNTIRSIIAASAVLTLGLGLSACAEHPEADSGAAPKAELKKVSFALDWAPNTNHTEVFVAQELGYFEDAGIELEILPYASSSTETLVDQGLADFGISGQSATQVARTAGSSVISVFQITQHDTGNLVVLGDREDLKELSDLDGLNYGGFGSPLWTAVAKETIKGGGGKGEFTEVSLDTGSYEALAQHRIDFTLTVSTWQNVQAEIDGEPYRAFKYQDYGVPEQHATGIITSEKYIAENEETVAAFVAALSKAQQFTIDNPVQAAQLLIQANPDTLGTSEELVTRSVQVFVDEQYQPGPGQKLGTSQPENWDGFGQFLLEHGLLLDPNGQVLSEAPDWSTYYTNKYLP